MKTCANCKKEFPFLVDISGKKRNLQSRKFCLECLPFGSNHRFAIKNESIPDGHKTCSSCKVVKPEADFYLKNRRSSRRSSICKDCISKSVIDRIRKMKKQAVEYKGGKCEICGYSKCLAALDFHHRNPLEKDADFYKFKNRAFESFKPELDKCALLCCRCHRELHSEEHLV